MVLFSFLSDRRQRRGRYIVLQVSLHLVGCITLSIWPRSFVWQMVGFHFLFLSNAAGPVLLAWLADVVRTNPEERTLTVACMVTAVYTVDCWANLLLWPASEAPEYRYGYRFAAAFSIGCILSVGWVKLKLRGWRWGSAAEAARA
ncbi:hypothetical protein FPV67DRAFT_1683858 [Lyophyllum atratum]|nr:hypothetical protein FPV67DRAFT_1683858 [Lyophyllum atratum]